MAKSKEVTNKFNNQAKVYWYRRYLILSLEDDYFYIAKIDRNIIHRNATIEQSLKFIEEEIDKEIDGRYIEERIDQQLQAIQKRKEEIIKLKKELTKLLLIKNGKD